MTWTVGLMGLKTENLSKLDHKILRERSALLGGHTLIPVTAKEITRVVEEIERGGYSAVLVPKNVPIPEHIYGVLKLAGVSILRITNKLEVLVKFDRGEGVFEFCGTDMDKIVFPDKQLTRAH